MEMHESTSVCLELRLDARGFFSLRPVPNVVLLLCQTQMKLSFRFKQGSSMPFETIKCGMADLGSA